MNKMKKYLLTIFLIFLTNGTLFAKEQIFDFKLDSVDTISSKSKFYTFHNLKDKQYNIVRILKEMDKLILDLEGFEEQNIAIELQNIFRDKYLIMNGDILYINKTLNRKLSTYKDSKEQK